MNFHEKHLVVSWLDLYLLKEILQFCFLELVQTEFDINLDVLWTLFLDEVLVAILVYIFKSLCISLM